MSMAPAPTHAAGEEASPGQSEQAPHRDRQHEVDHGDHEVGLEGAIGTRLIKSATWGRIRDRDLRDHRDSSMVMTIWLTRRVDVGERLGQHHEDEDFDWA